MGDQYGFWRLGSSPRRRPEQLGRERRRDRDEQEREEERHAPSTGATQATRSRAVRRFTSRAAVESRSGSGARAAASPPGRPRTPTPCSPSAVTAGVLCDVHERESRRMSAATRTSAATCWFRTRRRERSWPRARAAAILPGGVRPRDDRVDGETERGDEAARPSSGIVRQPAALPGGRRGRRTRRLSWRCTSTGTSSRASP